MLLKQRARRASPPRPSRFLFRPLRGKPLNISSQAQPRNAPETSGLGAQVGLSPFSFSL
jgi:hypothetical protein